MAIKVNNLVSEIAEATKDFTAMQLLEHVAQRFGAQIALATSFGAEDQVLTDMICQGSPRIPIFTLDTGRLPQETYDVMAATREKYGVEIKTLFPDSKQIEEMVTRLGPNLFYESIENRKLCCRIRKVDPLKRQLAELKAWICGLRQEQSVTRDDLERVAWDDAFGLIKVCPLADWSTDQIWEYIRHHEVHYNKLHEQGYPSIGCGPCTRAVEPGQDIRSGRWWWEEPEHKECGLHLKSESKD
jgi:phosphoadenosine phosphosulfate reductase